MDTQDIHPLTAMMADIIIDNVIEAVAEIKMPRSLAMVVIGNFLADYETKSLLLATEQLLRDTRDSRKRTEKYLDLTIDDLANYSETDKARMMAETQMAVLRGLMMETVMELVSPLTGD